MILAIHSDLYLGGVGIWRYWHIWWI